MNEELREAFTKLLVISAFLAYAGNGPDVARKMSKLRRQIRLGLKKDTLHFREEMVELSSKTDKAYADATRAIPKGRHLKVLLSLAMDILWATLDGNKYKHRWFTDKTFREARNSLGHGAAGFPTELEDTYWLVDTFLENAGYKRESELQRKIRLAKKIKETNDILEGK